MADTRIQSVEEECDRLAVEFEETKEILRKIVLSAAIGPDSTLVRTPDILNAMQYLGITR